MESQSRGEIDADTDPGAKAAVSKAADRTTPRRSSRIRSFPRARQPAVERPDRAAEASGGRFDGKALETAEHHRQTKGPRQAVDLVVDGLGLFAVDHRPVGRWDRSIDRGTRAHSGSRAATLHGNTLFTPAPAIDLLPRAPGRPGRDSVQPVAQQVGVPDRPGLPGQYEEHSLKGVLSMLQVAEELTTDS